ncbi:MAG TPA: LCP family protein [Streptosporangiaceae bacterium]|nr:LCP family protein [Streptosporangiaceae bacterium]
MPPTRLGGAGNLRHAVKVGHGGFSFSRMIGVGVYTSKGLITGWSAIGVTLVLVLGTLYGYVKYRDLWDGINRVNISEPGKRPPKFGDAMNLLLIGSDSRSGHNRKLGGYAQGQRSDTVMIVHISPRAGHIYVMSFPRDTVVPIVGCNAEAGYGAGQKEAPGEVEQLNSTFAYGGPGCLWTTLETVTHIHIDNFVQLNFTGFVNVINALGGVEVCVPYPIHATRYDHLHLTAGRHFIYGNRALEFWRLREDFGLGSDLQRIQRDQLLMVAMVQRILKTGVLHSYTKTYKILSTIVSAHALTTDAGLSPSRIVTLARSLAGVSKKSVQFIEVPTVQYPNNPNWVEFDSTQTPELFSAVAHDVKLPKVHKGKKGKKGAEGKGKAGGKSTGGKSKSGSGGKSSGGGGKHKHQSNPPPTPLSTSAVSVEVINGGGVQGIAGTTSEALTKRGFHVLGATSAPAFTYVQSVVEYNSSADLAAAKTVEAQLPGDVTLREDPSVPAGTINLILGSDFTALGTPGAHNGSGPGNLGKKYGGYSANTSLCKGFGNAFAQS